MLRKFLKKAQQLTLEQEPDEKLAYIIYGLSTYYLLRENYDSFNELVDRMLEIGRGEEKYIFNLIGLSNRGIMSVLKGDYNQANLYLRKAVDFYDPNIPIVSELTPGGDIRIVTAVWLTISLHGSGQIKEAVKLEDQIKIWSNNIKDPRTTYHVKVWSSWLRCQLRQWSMAEKIIDDYLPSAKEFGDPFFIAVASQFQLISRLYQNKKTRLEEFSKLFKRMVGFGSTSQYPLASHYLVELHLLENEYEKGLELVNESIQHLEKTGSFHNMAELLRLKAIIISKLGKPVDEVIELLKNSLSLASRQGAKSLLLRTSRTLADIYGKSGLLQEALDVLGSSYNLFDSGFDSPDLIGAKLDLERLRSQAAG